MKSRELPTDSIKKLKTDTKNSEIDLLRGGVQNDSNKRVQDDKDVNSDLKRIKLDEHKEDDKVINSSNTLDVDAQTQRTEKLVLDSSTQLLVKQFLESWKAHMKSVEGKLDAKPQELSKDKDYRDIGAKKTEQKTGLPPSADLLVKQFLKSWKEHMESTEGKLDAKPQEFSYADLLASEDPRRLYIDQIANHAVRATNDLIQVYTQKKIYSNQEIAQMVQDNPQATGLETALKNYNTAVTRYNSFDTRVETAEASYKQAEEGRDEASQDRKALWTPILQHYNTELNKARQVRDVAQTRVDAATKNLDKALGLE